MILRSTVLLTTTYNLCDEPYIKVLSIFTKLKNLYLWFKLYLLINAVFNKSKGGYCPEMTNFTVLLMTLHFFLFYSNVI